MTQRGFWRFETYNGDVFYVNPNQLVSIRLANSDRADVTLTLAGGQTVSLVKGEAERALAFAEHHRLRDPDLNSKEL